MPTSLPSRSNVAQNLSSRIGTHPRKADSYAEIHSLGARWARFGWAVMLDRVCAGGRGTFDFANQGESLIDGSVTAGLSVLAILDGRWGWEADCRNLIPWATPIWEHWDVWDEYVHRAVSRYKDRVRYWEMGNEPPFFWMHPHKDGLPRTDGPWKRAPIRHYAEKVRRTAAIIRQVDPAAQNVLGSTFPDGQFLRQCYDHGLREHFDIASVHYLHCHTRERFREGYDNLRAILEEHGDGHKELWDTESGPDGGELSLPTFPVEEYTGLYNIYRHCFAHESGLERYFWFPSEEGVRPSGGGIAPSYQALQNLHRHVAEGRLMKARHLDDAVHVYVFDGPEGPASVLWGTAEARGRFCSEVPPASDAFGAPVRLNKEGSIAMPPLLVRGDLLDGSFEASRTGKAFVAVTPPRHKPDRSTAAARIPKAPKGLSRIPELWRDLPLVCHANPSQRRPAIPTFMLPHSSTEADLRLAWDEENFYFEAVLADAVAADGAPRGLVQFTLRDTAEGEMEDTRSGLLEREDFVLWKTIDRGRFFNGYALLSVECGLRGDRVLRSECQFPRNYQTGILSTCHVSHAIADGRLSIQAAISWAEIGPCRPDSPHPLLFMVSFGLTDGPLDVPDNEDPMEWHQNYQHGFVVRAPAEQRWLFLAK